MKTIDEAYEQVAMFSHEEDGEIVTGEMMSLDDMMPFIDNAEERYSMYVFANKILHKFLSTR